MSRINLLQSPDAVVSRRKQDAKLRLISVVVGGAVLIVGAVLLGVTFFQQQSYNVLLQQKAALVKKTAESAGAQKKLALIDAALRYVQKERIDSPDYLTLLRDTTQVINASDSSLLVIELKRKEALIDIEFSDQNELTQFLSFLEAREIPQDSPLQRIEIKSIAAPAINKPVTLQVRFPYGTERTTKK